MLIDNLTKHRRHDGSKIIRVATMMSIYKKQELVTCQSFKFGKAELSIILDK